MPSAVPPSPPARSRAALLVAALALTASACAPAEAISGQAATPEPSATPASSLSVTPPSGPPTPAPTPAPAPSSGTPTPAGTTGTPCPAPRKIDALPRPGRFVALTFDDGPSPHSTRPILDILDREGVRATFFDIGSNTAEFPQIQREVAARGHVIANHTWSHPWLTKLTAAQLAHELDATTALFAKNTGQRICFVRPPMGGTNPRVEAAIMARGQSVVMWQGDTNDWKAPGVEAIVRNALASAPRGESAIVLLHDAKMMTAAGQRAGAQTVAALPRIIAGFKARGYAFVQVDGTDFPPR